MKLYAANQIDFYKTGHHLQYPPNTEYVYSNFTARSGSKSNVENSKGIIFIGLQLLSKDYLIDEWNESFFNQEHDYIVGKYKKLISTALNENISVDHISALHKLGYLPIKIKALPEGSFVPYKVPVFTIVNTDPRFYWLPNYLESVLSAELWPLCTTATTYFEYMKVLHSYAEMTGANTDFIHYQIHDFSYRGMFGREAAAKSSFAAIACGSAGTDSIPGIDIAEQYYNASGFIAGSIPATEHSVMSSNIELLTNVLDWSRSDAELEAFRRLITDVYPNGNISIVSDTFDFWNVVGNILPALKSIIMKRDGKVVIRPDSGDPVDIICGRWDRLFKDFDLSEPEIPNIERCLELMKSMMLSWNMNSCDPGDIVEEICGYFKYENVYYKIVIHCDWDIPKDYDDIEYDRAKLTNYHIVYSRYEPSCQELGLIESLWNIFGGNINDKGYKTLDSHIGAIYGDSITLKRQKEILEKLKQKRFASDNIVFGVGSYSYQYVTRDTHSMAMKATSVIINGTRYDIYKDPKTDNGTKKSARGLLMVIEKNGEYELVDQCTEREEKHGCLETVFENGRLVKEVNLDDVRNRVKSYLK